LIRLEYNNESSWRQETISDSDDQRTGDWAEYESPTLTQFFAASSETITMDDGPYIPLLEWGWLPVEPPTVLLDDGWHKADDGTFVARNEYELDCRARPEMFECPAGEPAVEKGIETLVRNSRGIAVEFTDEVAGRVVRRYTLKSLTVD
jgi:hypothetical protein